MKQKSEEIKRLESNVANIILNYKLDRAFKVDEIVNKLKEVGFPYIKVRDYQRTWSMIQGFLARDLITIIPKSTGSKYTRYKITNIDELHRELYTIIDPAHINSPVKHIDPTTIVTETKGESENKPVVKDEIDCQEARPHQCMLETMEFISDAPKNEFTAEEIYSDLCSDGLDVTLREIRMNVASLAKENIIKISGKGFDVYKLIRQDIFYKRLYYHAIKTANSQPPQPRHLILTNVEIGNSMIDYIEDAWKTIESLKIKLEETKEELTLYKEEVSVLENKISKLKGL